MVACHELSAVLRGFVHTSKLKLLLAEVQLDVAVFVC